MATRPTPKKDSPPTGGRPGNRTVSNRYRRRPRAPRIAKHSLFTRKGLKAVHLALLLGVVVAVFSLVALVLWGKSSKLVSMAQTSTVTRDRAHPAGKALDHGESPKLTDASQPQDLESHARHQIPPPNEKPTIRPRESNKPARAPSPDANTPPTGNHYAALPPKHNLSEPPKSIPPLGPPAPPLTPPIARVAIVIDDFGVDLNIAKKFIELPIPVTLSILPHQRYSREIGDLAHARHRQVILHLPMEPKGYPRLNPGKGALLVSMSGSAIQKSISAALESSPHFSGMNNHMGSRFTENKVLMTTVIEEAQKHDIYFIDSYTTSLSVAATVAQQSQIPFRRRDIFLDNNQSEDAIRTQIRQVIRRAKIQGSVLAIGHPYESTLRALSHESELFEREGVAVVPAGELIKGSCSHFNLDLAHGRSYEDQAGFYGSLTVYT